MTTALEILQRRLLEAVEQVGSTDQAPKPWSDIEPEHDGHLRPAAAVFERVAEKPSREEIVAELRCIAKRITEHREGQDKSGEKGEASVFTKAAEAVEGLDRLEPDRASLLGLSLWQRGKGPVGSIQHALRSSLPKALPVDEELLTRAAQILLRGRARAWVAKARRLERKEASP